MATRDQADGVGELVATTTMQSDQALHSDQSSASLPARPLTMFVHIPKTAGTTFNSVLSYQYGHRRSLWVPWDHVSLEDSVLQQAPQVMARLKLIRGHFPFGWDEHIARPVRYITMLRHPVDRIVSMYHYFQQGPECREQRVALACKSVEEFVASGATPQVVNDQVRRLSGDDLECEVQATHLESAKRNLDRRFSCFGLTERFDESLLMMSQALQWRRPLFYLSSNVTRRRPKLAELSSATRSVIERHNELDMELYEHANKAFDCQLDSARDELAAARRRLHFRNRVAGRLLPAPLWIIRRVRRWLPQMSLTTNSDRV